jgi:uncharacterized cupredoxin-like copper-binding protein
MRRKYRIQWLAVVLILGAVLAADGQAQDPWKTVRLETDEYRFVPNRIQLEAGQPARLEIRNIGNEEHEFRSRFLSGSLIEVLGNGVIVKATDIHSVIVETGSTAVIKWLSPEAGIYFFECRIPSHHGMDGTIIVKKVQ